MRYVNESMIAPSRSRLRSRGSTVAVPRLRFWTLIILIDHIHE